MADLDIAINADVKLRCEMSKAFEKSGDYEKAREALGGLWRRIGERPDVDGLGPDEAAEALLQVGRLTSSLGRARQVDGAQESAKNLISESIALFEKSGSGKKVAEAQTAIAVCYWREGAFDEARVMLKEALSRLSSADVELRAAALITHALVERSANRYDVALEILREAAPIVEASESDALKGSFHNQLATTLENFGRAERRPEMFDQALIEYAAASFHLEQAGHTRYCAGLENNLGFLFHTIGRYDEAHEHLTRARTLFVRLKDVGMAAQVDETRARVLIAEGRLEEAEKSARAAVQGLEAGGEQALLAEALATRGVALARLGRHAEARQSLERAVETAERGGDPEGAGHAAIVIIEELDEQTTAREMHAIFERASDLLASSQNPATLARLNACARRVIRALSPPVLPARASEESPATVEQKWEGFSLKREALRYEAELIANALRDANGVVSHAAKLLGFKHHQTFVALLNNRHKSLLHARNPINPRKRSAAHVRAPRRNATHRADREMRSVTILLVEDNKLVADAIRDTLEFEGWRVESCPDGSSALLKVEGGDHFDLILLDENLPGLSGLDLTHRARGLRHRQGTPIIIISATNCQTAARDAGANAFLKKPQDILALVPTITQLLDLKAVV
ncbi:MAG TPA: tetratricopeptide repeat protein [Pyrinomonadaceae bacterium]|nr:tetratricopeptide repeat protein [Pyrinomonadaceae bacterium]